MYVEQLTCKNVVPEYPFTCMSKNPQYLVYRVHLVSNLKNRIACTTVRNCPQAFSRDLTISHLGLAFRAGDLVKSG